MTYKIGDRVQLLFALHQHPKGDLRIMACMDYEGDRTGRCGIPNLRGTVIRGGLDTNGQEFPLVPEHIRPLDAVERLGELAGSG